MLLHLRDLRRNEISSSLDVLTRMLLPKIVAVMPGDRHRPVLAGELVPVAQRPEFIDTGSRDHEVSEDRGQNVEGVDGCDCPCRVGIQNRAGCTMLRDHVAGGIALLRGS